MCAHKCVCVHVHMCVHVRMCGGEQTLFSLAGRQVDGAYNRISLDGVRGAEGSYLWGNVLESVGGALSKYKPVGLVKSWPCVTLRKNVWLKEKKGRECFLERRQVGGWEAAPRWFQVCSGSASDRRRELTSTEGCKAAGGPAGPDALRPLPSSGIMAAAAMTAEGGGQGPGSCGHLSLPGILQQAWWPRSRGQLRGD